MARQAIVPAYPLTVYVNETGTRQTIAPTVYVNETISAAVATTTSPSSLMLMMGVG